MTTTDIKFAQSKSQIIQRLLEEKHITVEEAMTLMVNENNVQYVPVTVPQTPSIPHNPLYPPSFPFYYTSSTDKKMD